MATTKNLKTAIAAELERHDIADPIERERLLRLRYDAGKGMSTNA